MVLFAIPILAIMFMASIVGLGIGFILLAIYAIMLYISAVVSCFAIATTIVKDGSKGKILGLTVLIYLAIRILSIFSGWFVLISMLLGLAGLGFMVRNAFYKEKPEEAIKEI